MKKIILASGSVQRKALLQSLGVEFTIKTSNVIEADVLETTCCDLVKHNALLKAEDVAGNFQEGIVIGADTLVCGPNEKVIGKPKDLKEAKKILHELFADPHWVYTGVALIDAQTKKTVVDFEKTKVFMSALTDQEIDRYHKKVSPIDKAGGFDIEGFGSIFVHRIEGCYTNVIGLPMAKLSVMLKSFGVSLL